MQLQQGNLFRGCCSRHGIQAPTLVRPPGCTHRSCLKQLGSQAVYATHSSVGYLPRDVVSLRVRHERLIRLDFHQLDCSLVGCSDVPNCHTYLFSSLVISFLYRRASISLNNASRSFFNILPRSSDASHFPLNWSSFCLFHSMICSFISFI